MHSNVNFWTLYQCPIMEWKSSWMTMVLVCWMVGLWFRPILEQCLDAPSLSNQHWVNFRWQHWLEKRWGRELTAITFLSSRHFPIYKSQMGTTIYLINWTDSLSNCSHSIQWGCFCNYWIFVYWACSEILVEKVTLRNGEHLKRLL